MKFELDLRSTKYGLCKQNGCLNTEMKHSDNCTKEPFH